MSQAGDIHRGLKPVGGERLVSRPMRTWGVSEAQPRKRKLIQ